MVTRSPRPAKWPVCAFLSLTASSVVLAAVVAAAPADERTLSPHAQVAAAAPAPPPQPPVTAGCSKAWLGHEAEYEAALRTATFDKVEDIPIGVTKPKHVYLKDGGPAHSVAWKPIPPGVHGGFWDSYRSEIAAYQLDKLLVLGMVPPSVERQLHGESGAAILWVENVKGWKVGAPVTGPDPSAWTMQIVAMKMFDNLIGNNDRNQGNLLYDPDYHLILIDHSRAFSRDQRLVVEMQHVDLELWARMDALTEEAVATALADSLDRGQVRALMGRRDRMRAAIARLVKDKGERSVFIAGPGPD